MTTRIARLAALTAFAVFLYLPIIVVAASSLDGTRQMVFPPEDPGFTWYVAFFEDPAWTGALEASLLIAVLASLASTTVATLVCWLVWRRATTFDTVLERTMMIPFLLPGIVFAVAVSLVIGAAGLLGTVAAIVIGHAAAIIAIPLVTIGLGFSLIQPSQIEAARTMGVTGNQMLPMVLMPMIRPYILTGALFAMIISMNEYVLAFMLSGFALETLPVKVYNSQRYGFTPTLSVGTVLYMTFSLVIFSAVAASGRLYALLGIETSVNR